METILILAHTESDGSLAQSAREALHAARSLNKALAGSNLFVGLIGENVQAAADSIAACPATKYFGVTGADFSQPRYASDAAAAKAICKVAQATIVALIAAVLGLVVTLLAPRERLADRPASPRSASPASGAT